MYHDAPKNAVAKADQEFFKLSLDMQSAYLRMILEKLDDLNTVDDIYCSMKSEVAL
tara:strand:- start:299 stop:466 length:168 start_codon:yes stop_codon:yes gene_type:complete